MSTDLSVNFKEVGSQQLVSAFKNVGGSAQTATGQINTAGSATQQLGKGMKSSVSGIAQVATAFATLSLSIVNAYRSYRDLGDAQLQVDKSNKKVKDTNIAIAKLEKDIAAEKKANAKGSLISLSAQADLTAATEKYHKDQKDGKHTTAQLRAEYLKLQLQAKALGGSTGTLSDKEIKLGQLREKLGIQTDSAALAQKHFNDSQQDFYLSLAPLAISTIATLTTAFSGLKGALTGGGGLIGGLGPIGLILGGISLAIIAIQTNFLGLKDAIGGAIQWIKDRLGVWKDTLAGIFKLIQSGDWAGAFNLIKVAAQKFWQDLVKTVPFFGGVAKIVDQLMNGNWLGAFNTIKVAAIQWWADMKKLVPFLADVETFITKLTQGKWAEAFAGIGKAIQGGLESIFGKDVTTKFILKLQLMKDSAKTELGLLQLEFTKKGGPIDLINQGLAKLGSGNFAGGFSSIWVGLDKAIGIAITRINDWVKMNFGVDLSALATQAQAIGTKILDGIKGGLTFVAHTWIDPLLAQLFDPAVWTSAVMAIGGSVVAVGGAILKAIVGAVSGAAKDPKGSAQFWTDIGTAIWTGITTWMEANLPDTKKAMQVFAQGLLDAVNTASIDLQNVGIRTWNFVIGGFTAGLKAAAGVSALGPFYQKWIGDGIKNVDWANLGKLAEIKPTANMKQAETQAKQGAATIGKIKPIIKIDANLTAANAKWQAFARKVQMTTLQVRIAGTSVNIGKGSQAGAYGGPARAAGVHEIVNKPTLFMAGEGGRQEEVYVNPRGHSGRNGPSGGKGGDVYIGPIYLDGQAVSGVIRRSMTEGQGAYK